MVLESSNTVEINKENSERDWEQMKTDQDAKRESWKMKNGFGNKRSVDDELNTNGKEQDDQRSFKRLILTKAKANDFSNNSKKEAKA